MYCPKCGNHNLEEAQFCRSCGANLGLIPQALTGQLPVAPAVPPSAAPLVQTDISNAVTQAFMGLAFFLIAVGLFATRQRWGVWMLIPALIFIGRGVGAYLQARQRNSAALLQAVPQPQLPYTPPPAGLPPQQPGAIPAQPYSVTEATTRHLKRNE